MSDEEYHDIEYFSEDENMDEDHKDELYKAEDPYEELDVLADIRSSMIKYCNYKTLPLCNFLNPESLSTLF